MYMKLLHQVRVKIKFLHNSIESQKPRNHHGLYPCGQRTERKEPIQSSKLFVIIKKIVKQGLIQLDDFYYFARFFISAVIYQECLIRTE